jgi:hypothetical protein
MAFSMPGKNKVRESGKFFNAEKRGAKNHVATTNHQQFTTKKPRFCPVEIANTPVNKPLPPRK